MPISAVNVTMIVIVRFLCEGKSIVNNVTLTQVMLCVTIFMSELCPCVNAVF